MPQVRNVKLYGSLAKEYGDEHKVLGNSVYIMLSNLYKRNNKLRHDIKSQNWHIYLGDMKPENAIEASDLDRQINTDTIHIVPVVEGAEAITIAIVVGAVIGAAIAIFAMPEIPDNNAQDTPSYMFNGSQNVIDQGGAVPIVCGLCRVGTTIISAGTYAEDVLNPTSPKGTGLRTVLTRGGPRDI